MGCNCQLIVKETDDDDDDHLVYTCMSLIKCCLTVSQSLKNMLMLVLSWAGVQQSTAR